MSSHEARLGYRQVGIGIRYGAASYGVRPEIHKSSTCSGCQRRYSASHQRLAPPTRSQVVVHRSGPRRLSTGYASGGAGGGRERASRLLLSRALASTAQLLPGVGVSLLLSRLFLGQQGRWLATAAVTQQRRRQGAGRIDRGMRGKGQRLSVAEEALVEVAEQGSPSHRRVLALQGFATGVVGPWTPRPDSAPPEASRPGAHLGGPSAT
ncbi:hypothetical protein TARUN_1897 [Trichoderma arundinaceum]|uniref:Uncharacterized protein n=1 Tax=Trichoderma arundinaceum TaxID=490622 RepID=A0A395NX02_TRIAR|nr:hypothetical protein TARUN_1897 [Trichoderma arundinaceum]